MGNCDPIYLNLANGAKKHLFLVMVLLHFTSVLLQRPFWVLLLLPLLDKKPTSHYFQLVLWKRQDRKIHNNYNFYASITPMCESRVELATSQRLYPKIWCYPWCYYALTIEKKPPSIHYIPMTALVSNPCWLPLHISCGPFWMGKIEEGNKVFPFW